MPSLRLRPRFRYVSKSSTQQIQDQIIQALQGPDAPCIGTTVSGYTVLKIQPKDQHFWSPQLGLSFEDQEGGALVRGLYGPSPNIWTLFSFGYAALGAGILFIGLIGLSKLSLDMDASILWWVPILSVAILVMYIIAQTGKKLGAEQITIIHQFLEKAMSERIQIH